AEYVIAVAIGSVLLVTMAALSIFGAQSFATTNDFVDLDQASRLALDTMSQEIRQADRVVNCSSNQITFQSGATTINYSFRPAAEHGNVLLVGLFTAMVVGLALVSYLSLTSNHQLATSRSQAWNAAMPLVEAGIEEALAHLNADKGSLGCCGWSLSGTNYSF